MACGMEMECRGSRRGLDRLGALGAVQCEGDGVRWEGGIARMECPPKPDDTADALAIAICHAHSGASRLAQYYNK